MREPLALMGGRPVRSRPFTSWPVFDGTEEAAVLRALRSGKWGRLHGSEVANFEKRFARMHGCEHAVAVVNGTVSLRIALLAAGVQENDEVIIPPYTFFSTASAVIETNAVPVFADVDLQTFNLDVEAVSRAITPRTRAVIPVHFAGQPADMGPLMRLAREHNLVVIEDAAHAHGAALTEGPAGSLGHMGSFSFQSSKNLTCGEGGILTTNDERLAAACYSVHNCGRVPEGVWYEHHVISGNYRLGELQGALLNAQLERLEFQTRKRDENGQYLAQRINSLPGVFPQRRLPDCMRHSYHLFMLRLDTERFGAPRERVVEALRAEGIPCSAGYGFPLYRQPMFQKKSFGPYLAGAGRLDYTDVRCPNSEILCRQQAMWIEQSLFLGEPSDMNDIANAFEKIYENRGALNPQRPEA